MDWRTPRKKILADITAIIYKMNQEYLKSVQAELAAARQPADKVAKDIYNQQAATQQARKSAGSGQASPRTSKQATKGIRRNLLITATRA